MTTNLQNIKDFLSQQHIAIAGVSRTSTKFGNQIWKEFYKKGISLYILHPEMQTFKGERCYSDINELPPEVTALIICTKPEKALELIQAATSKGIKHIWLQQGIKLPEAEALAADSSMNLIYERCILMFSAGGMHHFHAWLLKMFNKYPN